MGMVVYISAVETSVIVVPQQEQTQNGPQLSIKPAFSLSVHVFIKTATFSPALTLSEQFWLTKAKDMK
jgi:hypothetical protein